MTKSKIRRGVLPKNQPRILFRERGKKIDHRDKSFDDFRLMVVDPPPKLDGEESKNLSCYFGISIGNQ